MPLVAGAIAPTRREQRLLYLQRETQGSREHNDNHQGATRAAANEAEVAAALRARGFTILRLGRASLRDKAAALAGASLVLTPVGANALNLLLQPSPPSTWLFLDPADLGAFSACWVCCMARLLWRERPAAHVLGSQPGVSLERLDPTLVTWAVSSALDATRERGTIGAAHTATAAPPPPTAGTAGAPPGGSAGSHGGGDRARVGGGGPVRRGEPCVCATDGHVVGLRWLEHLHVVDRA